MENMDSQMLTLKQPNHNFWEEFWENRCVTLGDTETESETDAVATEPPVGAVQETEEDYDEYS